MTASNALPGTWRRRARTVPTMLAVTALLVLLAPLWLPLAVVVDLLRGRWKLPLLRVLLFGLQYAVNDTVEILLAPVLWMWAGFGRSLDSERSVRRHQVLQEWSIAVLGRRARRLLGLRVELDDASWRALGPAPVIVLCRHVNVVDASLPSLLYGRIGIPTRGVIMAEMLADPGFDLIYSRAGSVFIPRADGANALALVEEMSRHADRADAVVIFPEGRLFDPDARDRAVHRIAAADPERADRVRSLRHVVPARPGGVLALLAGLPDRDVVVMAHSGLEPYPTFRSLTKAVPLQEPVLVSAWRVPRADIPDDVAAQTEWLDRQWARVDAAVASRFADG